MGCGSTASSSHRGADPSTSPVAVPQTRTVIEYRKDGAVSKMRSHKVNVPVRPQEKLCPPAKFTTNRDFNRHLRTHTGDRSHRCDACDAQFTHSDSLTRHKKTCGDSSKSLPFIHRSCVSPTFPDTRLSPDHAGYGVVGCWCPRQTNYSEAPIYPHFEPPWSPPVPPTPTEYATSIVPFHHRSEQDASPRTYNASYSYPPPRQFPDARVSSPRQRGPITSPAPISPLVRERSRYSPYPPSTVVTQRKRSTESMSLGNPYGNRLPGNEIKLAPIKPVAPPRHFSTTSLPYALPPISTLEDFRGISSQDSTAVLKRLKMDDGEATTTGTTLGCSCHDAGPELRVEAFPSDEDEMDEVEGILDCIQTVPNYTH